MLNLLPFFIWLEGVNLFKTKCQAIRSRVSRYRKRCQYINTLIFLFRSAVVCLFVCFIHTSGPASRGVMREFIYSGFSIHQCAKRSEHALIFDFIHLSFLSVPTAMRSVSFICFNCYEVYFWSNNCYNSELSDFSNVWIEIFRIVCFFNDFWSEIYLSFVFFVFSDCFLLCSNSWNCFFFIMIMLSFDRENCYMYDDLHIFENAMFLIINRFQSVFRFRNRRRCRCLINHKLR